MRARQRTDEKEEPVLFAQGVHVRRQFLIKGSDTEPSSSNEKLADLRRDCFNLCNSEAQINPQKTTCIGYHFHTSRHDLNDLRIDRVDQKIQNSAKVVKGFFMGDAEWAIADSMESLLMTGHVIE